jgi:hypothetical protein
MFTPDAFATALLMAKTSGVPLCILASWSSQSVSAIQGLPTEVKQFATQPKRPQVDNH